MRYYPMAHSRSHLWNDKLLCTPLVWVDSPQAPSELLFSQLYINTMILSFFSATVWLSLQSKRLTAK